MRDFFNFGGAVLAALIIAASQLGDLYGPRGAKFTQASLIPLDPNLSDYAAAIADGSLRDAAEDHFDDLVKMLTEAPRG